jgi:AraC-like DNA-binding protein
VDALSGLLHEVRSDGALFGRSLLDPPWAVRFADESPLTLVTMLTGESWIVPDDADPVRIGPRDVAIVVGPGRFSVTDDHRRPTRPFFTVRGPDDCVAEDGGLLPDELWLDPRSCASELGGQAALLTGIYQVRGDVGRRLLTALPRVLVVPAGARTGAVLDVAVGEIGQDVPGQQAVLDRLLDLLLLTTLREWFALSATETPGWYNASRDPVVGSALELLHTEPARAWTVASLAIRVGVSRATLARRFRELMGEPPMTYLTAWRLALAADLFRRTDATLASVALQVGYADGYALSAAFKRHYGSSPRAVRAA